MMKHADSWIEPPDLAHPDRIRVRGYLLSCIYQLEAAQSDASRAVDAIEKARARAERKMARLRRITSHVELLTKLVASEDVAAISSVAQALENMEPQT